MRRRHEGRMPVAGLNAPQSLTIGRHPNPIIHRHGEITKHGSGGVLPNDLALSVNADDQALLRHADPSGLRAQEVDMP